MILLTGYHADFRQHSIMQTKRKRRLVVMRIFSFLLLVGLGYYPTIFYGMGKPIPYGCFGFNPLIVGYRLDCTVEFVYLNQFPYPNTFYGMGEPIPYGCFGFNPLIVGYRLACTVE